jgi:hypothetical protein
VNHRWPFLAACCLIAFSESVIPEFNQALPQLILRIVRWSKL